MFQKNKYIKSSQSSLNHKSNNGVSLQSSKYHPNIYSKKKSTLNKKINNNKFAQNHTWKKQNSYNNWNKENDKNYLNYEQYNSKNDTNKYYYTPKEKRENKQYNNKEYSNLYSYENNEYSYKPNNFQKNEKKISIDYATTQSNSSSHEESNNNNTQYNSNDNNNSTYDQNENFNSNDSQKINIEEENKNNQNNNNNIVTDLKNLNLNSNIFCIENNNNISYNPSIITKNNFQIENTNINNIQIPIIINPIPIPIQPKKNNKKPKKNKKICLPSNELDIKRSVSANVETDFKLNNEPYNKFNSVNNELFPNLINPVVENTEILQVNVKIAKDKNVIFKLRRFDDLFLTVKLFCEINSIEEYLIKPIITKALCTLNSIYQIYNTQLDSKNIQMLQMLKALSYETSIDY